VKSRHSATEPRGGAAYLENDEQLNRVLKNRLGTKFLFGGSRINLQRRHSA
jgi:hypothetical protein